MWSEIADTCFYGIHYPYYYQLSHTFDLLPYVYQYLTIQISNTIILLKEFKDHPIFPYNYSQ